MANDKHGRHLIVSHKEWICIINALDTLGVLVNGDALESDVLRDLRDAFPFTFVDELSTKVYNTN